MKIRNTLMIIFAMILVFTFTACGTPEESPKETEGENSGENNSQFEEEELDATSKEVKKFVEFLTKNAYKDAATQYNEKIVGNAELESEAIDCIVTFMENTANGVLAGAYSEKEAKVRNTTIEKIYNSTGCEIEEYDTLVANVEQALNSKVAYESGIAFLASKNYIDAIAEFEKVLEDDSNYSNAMEKCEEAIEGYKAKVIADADTKVNENDYPAAIDILKKAVNVLPEDSELLTKLNVCEKNYIAKAVSDSEAVFTDYTKYEEAVSFVQAALQYYPEDTSLVEKRDYYNSFAPVNLYDVNPVKGSLDSEINDVDTYQNSYTKSFVIGYYYDETAVYNLNASYNTFSATVYGRCTKTNTTLCKLVIKGDGKILYENYNIADNGKAFEIKFDVTGIEELTIVMEGSGNFNSSGYGMTNVILQRTEK